MPAGSSRHWRPVPAWEKGPHHTPDVGNETLNVFLSAGERRRATTGAHADLADAYGQDEGHGAVSLREKRRHGRWRRSERVNWRQYRACVGRVSRATRRRGEARRAGQGSSHLRDHRVGHGAVVRAMTAAAGWQARIVAGFETGRQGPEPEEEHEEYGDRAPHL